MKYHPLIKLDFKDFFLEGKFDGIKTGQTKYFIITNFPKPDDESDMGNEMQNMTLKTLKEKIIQYKKPIIITISVIILNVSFGFDWKFTIINIIW